MRERKLPVEFWVSMLCMFGGVAILGLARSFGWGIEWAILGAALTLGGAFSLLNSAKAKGGDS